MLAISVLPLLLLVTLFGAGAAPAQAQVPLHGIGFSKGCVSPVHLGDPYTCAFKVENTLTTDTAGDTLTIASIVDVVHAGVGDLPSGNLLPTLPVFAVAGGATCNATGGAPAPANGGNTACTFPTGSSIIFGTFSHHVVVAGDPNPLTDTATLTWQDLCTSGANNCPIGPLISTAASQATIPPIIPPSPPPPPSQIPTLGTWSFAGLALLLLLVAGATLRPRARARSC